MKRIKITDIVTGAAAKIKSGSLQHLQDISASIGYELAKSIIGTTYDSSKVYILYGCENSGSGSNYTMSAGAIIDQNGEIVIIPAQSITITGANVLTFQYVNTPVSGTNYDPVSFFDGSTHNIHFDRTGVWANAASTGAADWVNMVRVNGSYSPTLTANYVTGSQMKVYRRANQVFFSGLVLSNGSAAVGDTITTLRSEDRPSVDRLLFVHANSTVNGVTIRIVASTGAVKVDSVTGTPWASTNMIFEGQNYFI